MKSKSKKLAIFQLIVGLVYAVTTTVLCIVMWNKFHDMIIPVIGVSVLIVIIGDMSQGFDLALAVDTILEQNESLKVRASIIKSQAGEIDKLNSAVSELYYALEEKDPDNKALEKSVKELFEKTEK